MMKSVSQLALVVCIVNAASQITTTTAQQPSVDAQINNYLLSRGYDLMSRPVLFNDDTILVNISANMFNLFQVDQGAELIEFSGEFMLSWMDPFLSWTPNEYNATGVKMKEANIWKPDVVVETSIKTMFLVQERDRYVDIRRDGLVRMSYYAVFTNRCKLKVNYFPYDSQKCVISTGPLTFTSEEVLFVPGPAILKQSDYFSGNSEWDFVYMFPSVEQSTDPDIGFHYTAILWEVSDPYQILNESCLHFSRVTLKRKPRFYVDVLLVPTYIITTVALFGIFIPTNHLGDRAKKVPLGLTTMLSTAVILQIVASTMPKASTLPLLGNFILAEIFITGIAVVFSVAIIIIHRRALCRKWNPPLCLSRIASVLCFYRPFKPPHSIKKVDYDALNTDEQKSALVAEMEEMLRRVDEWIISNEKEEERRKEWNIIFDSLDLLFVVLFQVTNVILTATVI